MATRAAVDVFGHRDYRAFLRAFVERRKSQKDGFSVTEFSKRVGLRSPSYLTLVIAAERNLTADVAHRFAEACGLRGDSLEYFCALVAFNQAKTARERELHYSKLQGFRRYRAAHRLDAAQSAYHSEWYIPAIYELSARADFREDARWISSKLLPPIAPKQATQALSILHELGLLVRTEDGHVRQAHSVVETPDGPLGHHVVQFHRTMLQRAAEALDRIPREEREIASLTLCVSEAKLQEIKAELAAVRERLLQRYMSDPQPERVVQINFQMFPLTGKEE